jgi:tRNA(Ile)-lysidine synthase
VALLHLLADPVLELGLEAAYVHHGSRGQEADHEEDFCRRLCDELGVPFHALAIARPDRSPEGREATWRRLRYDALRDLAIRLTIPYVATGHHRDDVAEGVLVQLLRGCGPRALAGIAAQTPGGVIRPLLGYGRAQIRDWLAERNLQFRLDSSNLDPGHLRNRVRHDLLPALQTVAPRLQDHLVALAAALAEDESFLAAELDARACWIDPWLPDGGVLMDTIAALPSALRARWLHAQAERVGIGRVSRRQVQLMHGLLDRGKPRAVTLGGRWRLRGARGRLWLEPPFELPSYHIELELGSVASLPIPGLQVQVVPATHPFPADGWRWSPPDGACLSVRPVRDGDWLEAGGNRISACRRMAARLPRHLRAAWPVVCVDDTMSWIPGVWQPAGSEGCSAVEVVRG